VQAGARANHYNPRTGNSPIHVAAAEALPNIFRLLFEFPENRAEINGLNKDDVNALHILLAQLLDLANLEAKPLEARGSNPPTDADITESMINVLECTLMLVSQVLSII